MSEIEWLGGADSDRKEITEQHRTYLKANAAFDWEALKGVWSGAEQATFFNMNGHTYNGRDHWIRLWQWYKNHLKTGEWHPYDMRGCISGDLATVWCHRKTRLNWVGSEPKPNRKHMDDKDFTSRSTMVFRREDGKWRVVHVHFSEASVEPRPGGI